MGLIELLVVLVLIVALFGAYPGWGWNNGNYGPLGLVVFLILVVDLLRVAHIV